MSVTVYRMTKYKQKEYEALILDERPIITDVKVPEFTMRLATLILGMDRISDPFQISGRKSIAVPGLAGYPAKYWLYG